MTSALYFPGDGSQNSSRTHVHSWSISKKNSCQSVYLEKLFIYAMLGRVNISRRRSEDTGHDRLTLAIEMIIQTAVVSFALEMLFSPTDHLSQLSVCVFVWVVLCVQNTFSSYFPFRHLITTRCISPRSSSHCSFRSSQHGFSNKARPSQNSNSRNSPHPYNLERGYIYDWKMGTRFLSS